MRGRYLIAAAVVAMMALVLVVYLPLWEHRSPGPQDEANSRGDSDHSNSHVLVFASDPWPPYAGAAGGEKQGYIVEILRDIYEPLGYQVRYVNKPWTRCIAETRSGQLTGLAGCDVQQAPDLMYPRETIGRTRPTFYVRKGEQWRFTGVDSLKAIRLGAIQDYTYQRDVDAHIRKNAGGGRILLTKGNDAMARLIQALRGGRIDAFIENEPVAKIAIESSGSAADIVSAGQTEGLDLFVPLSPRATDARRLARDFDRGITRLRASGRLAEILSTYGLADWRINAEGASSK